MNNLRRKTLSAVSAAMLLASAGAQAGVVISGTRVVFLEGEREVSVKLSNEGATPALVQAWLDEGDPTVAPEDVDVPFVLTPAMFRLDPGNGQTLRLMKTGASLPSHQESLLWLNVLEIPPKTSDDSVNRLQLALRTRIKVMYRPAGLEGSADKAASRLLWSLVRDENAQGYALKASNPTPYVVNLGRISFKTGSQVYEAGAGHILPGESNAFPVSGLKAMAASGSVEFSAINDWGGGVPGASTLAAPLK